MIDGHKWMSIMSNENSGHESIILSYPCVDEKPLHDSQQCILVLDTYPEQ